VPQQDAVRFGPVLMNRAVVLEPPQMKVILHALRETSNAAFLSESGATTVSGREVRFNPWTS
jgi:hypothetical protein